MKTVHIGPLVIYKIINPHNYLLMMLNCKILTGMLDHERLKPANVRTTQGNVCNLAQLKQIINIRIELSLTSS